MNIIFNHFTLLVNHKSNCINYPFIKSLYPAHILPVVCSAVIVGKWVQSFQSGRADHCTVNTIRHIYCIQATRPHHHIIALSSIALGFNHKYNSLPHHKTHHPINRYILLLNPMNFKKHSPSFLAITFTQASRDPIKNSSRSIVIYCIFWEVISICAALQYCLGQFILSKSFISKTCLCPRQSYGQHL